MAAIALDIGGTKIEGATFTPDGHIIDRHRELIGSRTGAAVGRLASDIAARLLQQAAAENITITNIGVCVPGIVHRSTGSVWAPNIPGWDDYPLRDELAERFAGIGVSIDSDRSCSIYGESWLGSAAGCHDAVFVAVGTGIGLGIKVDGRVLHGFGDIAGATGWMALEPPYDHKFDQCGCFEYYASGTGIGANARLLLDARHRDRIIDFGGATVISDVRAEHVFRAYDDGDPIAIQVLEKAVQMWGMGAANIISLFNPEYLIWGGGVFGPAVRFIDDIRREAARWAQPIAMQQVKFTVASRDINPILAGAAYIAFNHL